MFWLVLALQVYHLTPPKTSCFNTVGIVHALISSPMCPDAFQQRSHSVSLWFPNKPLFLRETMNFRPTCVFLTGPLTESLQFSCTERPLYPTWRHPGPSTFVANWQFLFVCLFYVKCIFLYFALKYFCANLCNTAVNKDAFFNFLNMDSSLLISNSHIGIKWNLKKWDWLLLIPWKKMNTSNINHSNGQNRPFM